MMFLENLTKGDSEGREKKYFEFCTAIKRSVTGLNLFGVLFNS